MVKQNGNTIAIVYHFFTMRQRLFKNKIQNIW